MVDAGNPDMVARDIRGLYLSENEIGEIRKGATFQTHKEFCKAEAEPEDTAQSLRLWKRQWYQDKREQRARERKNGVDKENRPKFYNPDAKSSDFMK
jgi:hypothetical protein